MRPKEERFLHILTYQYDPNALSGSYGAISHDIRC